MLPFHEFMAIVNSYDPARYVVNFKRVAEADYAVTMTARDASQNVPAVTVTAQDRVFDANAILTAARFLRDVRETNTAAELASWAHTMRFGELPLALKGEDFAIERSVEDNMDRIVEKGKVRGEVEIGSSLGHYNKVMSQVIADYEVRQQLSSPPGNGYAALSNRTMLALAQEPSLTDAAVNELCASLTGAAPPQVPVDDATPRDIMNQLKRLSDTVYTTLQTEGVGPTGSSLTRSILKNICDVHHLVLTEVPNLHGQENEATVFSIAPPGDNPAFQIHGRMLNCGGSERVLPPCEVMKMLQDAHSVVALQVAIQDFESALRDEVPQAESLERGVRSQSEEFMSENAQEIREAAKVTTERDPAHPDESPDGAGV